MTSKTMENIWKILTENRTIEMEADDVTDLICTACKKVTIKPCNVPCGCRYCSKCLEEYLIGKPKFCLGGMDYCKVELINLDTNVFPDQAANMKISRLIVKCPLGSCEFKTQFNKLEEHIRSCNKQPMDCPYQAVGCSMIQSDIMTMKSHFTEYDHSHAKLLVEFMGNIENEIRMLTTEVRELREENRLIREERQMSKMEAEQSFILIAQDMVTPLSQENRSLMEELEIIKLNDKSKQKAIRALDEVMVQLAQENSSLRKEINSLKLDTQVAQETELALKRKIETTVQDSRGFEKRLTANQKQIDKIQAQINVKKCAEKPNAGNKPKLGNVTSNKIDKRTGEFVWFITNWDDKRKQAKTGKGMVVRSDPFYTHENGYKVCVDLQPNGSGTAIGTCMGLFISVMSGQFDKTLDWPFRLDVKLELVNQETGLAHTSRALDYGDTPSPNPVSNPSQNRYKNIGFRTFIPLAELDATPELCRRNTICIRVMSQVSHNVSYGFGI